MNKLPVVLYCHGLGATTRSGVALQAKKFVESRGLQFESIQYSDYGCIDRIWDVDKWLQDLLENIDGCKKKHHLSLLFGCSAGCHGILRAALSRPREVCGLMLLSPGVGLNLSSYIRTVIPQFSDDLMAGKNVLHPTAKDGTPVLVNRQCLQHFVDTCVSNTMASISIRCPIRIMHGSNDMIVPLSNVENFTKKLESNDVILSVVNGVGHSLPKADREVMRYRSQQLQSSIEKETMKLQLIQEPNSASQKWSSKLEEQFDSLLRSVLRTNQQFID